MTRKLTDMEKLMLGVPLSEDTEADEQLSTSDLRAAADLARSGVKLSYQGFEILVSRQALAETRAVLHATPAQQRLEAKRQIRRTLDDYCRRHRMKRTLSKAAHDNFYNDMLLWTVLWELEK